MVVPWDADAMNRPLPRALLGALAAALLTWAACGQTDAPPAAATAPAAEPTADDIVQKLIQTMKDNNFKGFVALGDAEFESSWTVSMFETVAAPVVPRMAKGYNLLFLGELKQQGCKVYLWKVAYKDNGDDDLLKLVLCGGRVTGFWVH